MAFSVTVTRWTRPIVVGLGAGQADQHMHSASRGTELSDPARTSTLGTFRPGGTLVSSYVNTVRPATPPQPLPSSGEIESTGSPTHAPPSGSPSIREPPGTYAKPSGSTSCHRHGCQPERTA